MNRRMKSVYFENLGCAKNQVDAEVMAHRLEKAGMTIAEDSDKADLIIVNTCGFIESAREESVNTFFELRNQYPGAKIILAGCLSQRYADELEKELPEADAIFGNRDLNQITQLVSILENKQENQDALQSPFRLTPDYPDPDSEDDTRNRLFNYPGSAFLKISEGCNHRCGYCAIPLIRGSLRSRPMRAVIQEAGRLVREGIKEINIVAQDLAAYGYDFDGKSHFAELLKALDSIDGDFAIRMLYIHPDWMTDEIITTIKDCRKVMHYFDIPFQHASAHLLLPMKRTGNQETYANLVEKIRTAMPDSVIRTTIMLGFPGDCEEDFEIVHSFIKRCRFTWMGSFIYSLEEDTPAFDMTTEQEHKELCKKAALWQKKLESTQQKITNEALHEFIGRRLPVLIEEVMEDTAMAIGRTYAQAPEVDGLTVVNGRGMKAGCVYDCEIVRVNGIDLEAVKID